MTTTIERPEVAEDFTTGEGLRCVLQRLHDEGDGAWEHDPLAAELMTYAAEKYARLARKHGLDPWEAASAAFEIMCAQATRCAIDPWAVITRGVHLTCYAEQRAQGLLTSSGKARRPQYSQLHDAERLSDRETPRPDYDPAFHVTDQFEFEDEGGSSDALHQLCGCDPRTAARAAISEAVSLFGLLGWPEDLAQLAIDRVCEVTENAGCRSTAYESLRRDKHALVLLDLPAESWSALLRAVLGNTDPALQATAAGRGVLLRLLLGETVEAMLYDNDLVILISNAAPERVR